MTEPSMSGWAAYLSTSDFVIIYRRLTVALGGDIAAAAILQRIAWRCERRGSYRATNEDLAQELGLSDHIVKTRTAKLVGQGWLLAHRESSIDPTRTFRLPGEPPVLPDSSHSAKSTITGDDSTPREVDIDSGQSGTSELPQSGESTSLPIETSTTRDKRGAVLDARANGGPTTSTVDAKGPPVRSDGTVTGPVLTEAERLIDASAPPFVVPRAIKARLCPIIDTLLADGSTPAHVAEALRVFWTRDHPHPNLLPNLVLDVARDAATVASYYETPEYRIARPDPAMLARMAQPFDPTEDAL